MFKANITTPDGVLAREMIWNFRKFQIKQLNIANKQSFLRPVLSFSSNLEAITFMNFNLGER